MLRNRIAKSLARIRRQKRRRSKPGNPSKRMTPAKRAELKAICKRRKVSGKGTFGNGSRKG